MSATRWFAVSALLTICLAPAAHAGDELYLRWDNCIGDGGVYNKTFACDTNAGSETLVGSFRLGETVSNVMGIEAVVEMLPLSGQTLPSWWQYYVTGSCRKNSLTVSFGPLAGSSACIDPWGTGLVGGYSYSSSTGFGQLKTLQALSYAPGITLPATEEVFAFQVQIDHALTVGPTACVGCSAPICIAWVNAQIDTGGPATLGIFGRDTPDHDWNVTWQPGGVTTVDPGDGLAGCQSVTPARAPTWGQIKSRYRR